jgi:hypothetical protein
MVMAPSSRFLQQSGWNFFIERGIRSTQEQTDRLVECRLDLSAKVNYITVTCERFRFSFKKRSRNQVWRSVKSEASSISDLCCYSQSFPEWRKRFGRKNLWEENEMTLIYQSPCCIDRLDRVNAAVSADVVEYGKDKGRVSCCTDIQTNDHQF